jgi:hypothetical protein
LKQVIHEKKQNYKLREMHTAYKKQADLLLDAEKAD